MSRGITDRVIDSLADELKEASRYIKDLKCCGNCCEYDEKQNYCNLGFGVSAHEVCFNWIYDGKTKEERVK